MLALLAVGSVFFDLNRYKPQLTAWLKARTGSTIEFSGVIQWTLFPILGFSAERFIVAGAPGFQKQPLLAVDHGEIVFNWLPLLSRELSINSLIIDGFTLSLSQDKRGSGNWQTIPGKSGLSDSNSKHQELNITSELISMAALLPENIMLTKGRINWDNRQTGDRFMFNRFNLKSIKSGISNRFDIALDTEVSLPSGASTGIIKFNSQLRYDNALSRMVFNDSRLLITGLDSMFPYRLPALSITANETSIDMPRQSMQINRLELEARPFRFAVHDLSAVNLQTKPELQASCEVFPFNPKDLLTQLGIGSDGIVTRDALSSAAAVFKLQASPDKFEVTGLKLVLDNTHADGFVRVENYKNPKFTFSLAADHLDLNRYFPASDNAGNFSEGIEALSDKLRLTLPLNKLKDLPAEGELNVSNLSVNGITMTDVHLQVSSTKGKHESGQPSQDRK